MSKKTGRSPLPKRSAPPSVALGKRVDSFVIISIFLIAMKYRNYVNRHRYFSQRDNDSDSDSGPSNECSYSAMAIFLSNLGIVGQGGENLDDQIEKEYESLGLRRGLPEDMSKFLAQKAAQVGEGVSMTRRGSRSQIREALQLGGIVICHTFLTRSGHIIAIVGEDATAYGGAGAWVCSDPYGECLGNYRYMRTGGFCVRYSFEGLGRAFGQDGDIWMHTRRE